MKKVEFNTGWKFVKGYVPSLKVLQMNGRTAVNICLPHDAMIFEKRDKNTKNGGATGFYPGGTYTYFKTFQAPEEWENKSVIAEFEGVYETAMVYINGNLVCTNKNGYTNFYANLTRYIILGEENELKVVADNQEENSRWYSGSGIYRTVNLYVANEVCIPADGVKLTAKCADSDVAVVEFAVDINNSSNKKEKLEVVVRMDDKSGNVYEDRIHLTAFARSDYKSYQSITIRNPKLWDCDRPDLYECTVELYSDRQVIDEWHSDFGIRMLSLDAVRGLRLNGKQVKLRGTCLHHDNGILGAATYADAEMRKVKLIKEAGFNSIRCAHTPMSRDFLKACDKLGILVMDELSDMWTIHKNNHDFAFSFLDECDTMITKMVNKDYNHACVIMYSVGNEIQEIGTDRGAEINRQLCNKFKQLDPTRYTTNGMNALNAAGARIYPVMQELAPLIQKKEQAAGTNDNSGSNAINSFMKLMEGEAGDIFAAHPVITDVLAESSESMDVIGLNYLTGRHLQETELHPNKCMVGTETFPADIVRLWDIVNKSDQVLGDFTWTGLDYLGEAGCGIFYYDGKNNFGSNFPDRTAYIGDIDLIGYRRPISYLREIVYGLRKEPYIAVERVDKYGKACSKTPWMFKDNIASWTWPGYEGCPTSVDVYSDADEVELLINGRSLGRKRAGRENGFTAAFEVCYEPGTIETISYKAGQQTGSYRLSTADKAVKVQTAADKNTLSADGYALSFIMINLQDANGIDNLFDEREVHVEVKGNGKLLALGSANPQSLESYHKNSCMTYDGYVLAAVQAADTAGIIEVNVWIDGDEENGKRIQIAVQ